MSNDAITGGAAISPAASPVVCPDGFVISSDCMDCGVCEYMCPEGAIFEAKNQFVIRKDACNGCGICVPYCPARAIVARTGFKERQARTVRQVLGGALGRS